MVGRGRLEDHLVARGIRAVLFGRADLVPDAPKQNQVDERDRAVNENERQDEGHKGLVCLALTINGSIGLQITYAELLHGLG